MRSRRPGPLSLLRRAGGDLVRAIGTASRSTGRRARRTTIMAPLDTGGVLGALALWLYATAEQVPSQFTAMTPYVATLLVMAFASQRLRMPAADGVVYRKGQAS